MHLARVDTAFLAAVIPRMLLARKPVTLMFYVLTLINVASFRAPDFQISPSKIFTDQ